MKKFFKNISLILLAIFISTLIFNILEPKPFKFENFKTKEEAQTYFNEHYPIGFDVYLLLDDLKKVGCKCGKWDEKVLAKDEWPKEAFKYTGLYGCGYENNFISRDPFQRYVIMIYTDEEDRVIEAYIAKHFLWA